MYGLGTKTVGREQTDGTEGVNNRLSGIFVLNLRN
jgi:hypothetical protein